MTLTSIKTAREDGATPRHSIAPFLLGLGITLSFLGLIASGLALVAGIVLSGAALTRWILDISQSASKP